MYSAKLLDHFQNPRNVGKIPCPDAAVRLENPACGDILELTLRLSDGQIAEVGFLAKGCVSTIACGSALTELVKGISLQAAEKIDVKDLERMVGVMPPASNHAFQLALDALKTLLKASVQKR